MFQTTLLSQFPAILQGGSVTAAQQWLIEKMGAAVTQTDVDEMGSLVASRNLARDPQTRNVLDSLIAEKAGVDLEKMTAPRVPQKVPTFLLFQKEPPRELRATAGLFSASLQRPSGKPPALRAVAEGEGEAGEAARDPKEVLRQRLESTKDDVSGDAEAFKPLERETQMEFLPLLVRQLSDTFLWRKLRATVLVTFLLEELDGETRECVAKILGESLEGHGVSWTGGNWETTWEAAKRLAPYEETRVLVRLILGNGDIPYRCDVGKTRNLLKHVLQQKKGHDRIGLLQILTEHLRTTDPRLKEVLIEMLASELRNPETAQSRSWIATSLLGRLQDQGEGEEVRSLVIKHFGPTLKNLPPEDREEIVRTVRGCLDPKTPEDVRLAAAVCLAQVLPNLETFSFDLVLEIWGALDFKGEGAKSKKILDSLTVILPKLGEEEKMELARRAAKHPSLDGFINRIGPHVYRSHLPEIVELALTAVLNRRNHRDWDISEVIAPLDSKEKLSLAKKLRKKYLGEGVDSAEIVFYLEAIELLLQKFEEKGPSPFLQTSKEKALAPFVESAGQLLKHSDSEVRKKAIHFSQKILPRLEAEDKIRAVEALEKIPADDLPDSVCWALATALPHLEEGSFKERSLSLGKRILNAEAGDFRWGDSLSALLHKIAEAHLEKFKEPESLRDLYQFFQGRLFDDPGKLNATAAAGVIALSTYFGPEERMAQMFTFGGLLAVRGGDDGVLRRIHEAFEENRKRFSHEERRLMAILALPVAGPRRAKNFLEELDHPHFAYALVEQVGKGEIDRGLMIDQLGALRGLLESVKGSKELLRVALGLLSALEHEEDEVRQRALDLIQYHILKRLEKPDLETLGLGAAGLLKKTPAQYRKTIREILFKIYSSLEDPAQRARLLMSLEEMLWREDEEVQAYGKEVFCDLLLGWKLTEADLREMVKVIQPKLNDPRPQNRRVALGVLKKIGERLDLQEILWTMIAMLLNDEEKMVRDEAKKSIYGIFGSIPSEARSSTADKILGKIYSFRFARDEEKILDAVEVLKVLATIYRGETQLVFLEYLIDLLSNVRESNDPFIRNAVVDAFSSQEFQRSLEKAIRKILHRLERQLAHRDPDVRLAVAKVMAATVEYYFYSQYNFDYMEPHLRTLAGMLLGDDSEEVRTTLIGFFEKAREFQGEEIRRFAERVLAAFAPPKPEDES